MSMCHWNRVESGALWQWHYWFAKEAIVLSVSDMGWETVAKVAAVSWEAPDSLGIHNSGATEGLKLYADTAWVLSLRCSRKFVSFRDLKGNLSMRLLAISSQFSVARSDSLAYFLSRNPAYTINLKLILFSAVVFFSVFFINDNIYLLNLFIIFRHCDYYF